MRDDEDNEAERADVARSLEQLLVSLQWGRQQTYYPSAQPLSTGEVAAANHKLADAINSHLLGNSSTSTVKSGGATAQQLCSSTPAEKMAEKVRNIPLWIFPFCHEALIISLLFSLQVLKILDPICPENKADPPVSDATPSNYFGNKKSIGRFHPYTRYENITFNCCERCTGDILVL